MIAASSSGRDSDAACRRLSGEQATVTGENASLSKGLFTTTPYRRLKVFGFCYFAWARCYFDPLAEIFPTVPCSPSSSHGFSDYTARPCGWRPLTSAPTSRPDSHVSRDCLQKRFSP